MNASRNLLWVVWEVLIIAKGRPKVYPVAARTLTIVAAYCFGAAMFGTVFATAPIVISWFQVILTLLFRSSPIA